MDNTFKTIGIIGMGLIGGSMAKSLSKIGNIKVYCHDANEKVQSTAVESGVAEGILDETELSICDLIIVALYPKDIISYVKSIIPKVKKGCVIIDICGIKRFINNNLTNLCNENDVLFVGCHPMAGKEVAGFYNSSDDLFKKASMIITDAIDNVLVEKLSSLFREMGFKQVIVTTAENHDRIMSYTSQLAHVVSGAYVKSPTAKEHKGYSAGSFKDMTRVAKLNPKLWCDLLMNNSDNLVSEIDTLVNNLNEYKLALQSGNEEYLYTLLKDGTEIKEALENEEAYN